MTNDRDDRKRWEDYLGEDRDASPEDNPREARDRAKKDEFGGRGLRVYMKELSKHPPLTPEQERSLISDFWRLRAKAFALCLRQEEGRALLRTLIDRHPSVRRCYIHGEFGLDDAVPEAEMVECMEWLHAVHLDDAYLQSPERVYREASRSVPESHEVAAALRASFNRGVTKEFRNEAENILRQISFAQTELCNKNMRLVFSRVGKYLYRGVVVEDLLQEGNIGLLKAVERFDQRRGYKLSTYAVWWIEQCMIRSLMSTTRTIRIPSGMVAKLTKVNRAIQEIRRETGRDPTRAELVARTGYKSQVVDELLVIMPNTTSFEAHAKGRSSGDDGGTFENSVGDGLSDENAESPDELVHRGQVRDLVRGLVDRLEPRHQKILRLYYGIGVEPGEEASDQNHTFQEIADVSKKEAWATSFPKAKNSGVTKQRIQQQHEQALQEIRSVLGSNPTLKEGM